MLKVSYFSIKREFRVFYGLHFPPFVIFIPPMPVLEMDVQSVHLLRFLGQNLFITTHNMAKSVSGVSDILDQSSAENSKDNDSKG